MRCICPTLALCLAIISSGCRTQTAALTNPFLAPDRVPPPATRTLVPGTAQPYYPGDPVPNSPAVMPPGALPTYAPQGSPVVPPGGWNTVPPQSGFNPVVPSHSGVRPTSAEIPIGPIGPIATVNEQPVQIQTDEQNLRFAQTPAQNFAVQPPPITPTPNVVQQQYPAQFTPQPSIAPNVSPAQTYPGQLTSYQEPLADPRAVRLRALPPGQAPRVNGSVLPVMRDGFRPQGSSRNRSAARPDTSSSLGRGFGPTQEAVSRFGFDPNYQWVRGQLEYSEAANQWKLRYIPIQQNPDQFGGSILIANPQVLGGVRPGEHVQLRGRLHARGNSDQAFAPIYTVSVVQRQQI